MKMVFTIGIVIVIIAFILGFVYVFTFNENDIYSNINYMFGAAIAAFIGASVLGLGKKYGKF
jgi:hypothetical protein